MVDLYLLPPQTNISQASVIVGKNVSLLSTRRNYIKRMVYEILRTRVLPTKEGVFIVRVKPRGQKITYESLAREISRLTTRE